MRLTAKRSGSRGRMRLALLLASAAAFLLVPVAMASAASATIEIEGGGSGWVKEIPLEVPGSPPIACHWNGTEIDVGVPSAGECVQATVGSEVGLNGIVATHEADPGSEFGGWKVIEGAVLGCTQESPGAGNCGVLTFGGPIVIKATFNKIPLPEFPLNVTTSGGGSGSVECKINGGAQGPCPAEVEEESSVELIAVPGVGSVLTEWTTGPCAGESSTPCSFTMPGEEVSANAEFNVATYSFAVTEEGEGAGSVECEVNAGGLGPCPTEATHGDTIKVVATPEAENIVESITGAGSAAGSCSIAGEGESGECEFEITANSSVNVVFESAGTKATTPATVEGEVPITTSLEGCEAPVVLGPFVPAVVENYLGNCGLTATSTGAESELSASDEDESPVTKGHLVQPPYKLPSALETRATGLPGLEFPGVGGPFAPLTSPVTLLTYPGPVSADAVTVFFRQHIGLHDALHTGTYAKTITLTLEQTTP